MRVILRRKFAVRGRPDSLNQPTNADDFLQKFSFASAACRRAQRIERPTVQTTFSKTGRNALFRTSAFSDGVCILRLKLFPAKFVSAGLNMNFRRVPHPLEFLDAD